MPSHKELLATFDEWDKENEHNMSARYIRAELQRLRRNLTKLDEGTNPEQRSHGEQAAEKAALASPRKDRVDEPARQEVPDGRPVEQQPRSFEDAAAAAHEHFMAQVSRGKEA